MKLIVALNNKCMKEELEKIYGDDVYKYDICDKEGVIGYLSKNTNENTILITKDTLEGNLDGRQYIKQIKFTYPNIKIIYIVEKLDMDYKSFLFSNEVINIIEGEIIDINSIVEIINTNKFIVYKNTNDKSEKKFITNKELIAICGTSGSGKSIVASLLTKELSKNINNSMALIDMNTYNPSIDIINNLEINSNILGQIVEDVDKYHTLDKRIKNYLLNDIENQKLSYLTNNLNIFESRNEKYNKYYGTIIDKIKSEFDISIVDLPSMPFLDIVNYSLINSTKILFVINPNYISIRQAVKYLDIITNLYNIPREKIGIVINKITRSSLDNIQIRSLLKGYKIVLEILYDRNIESLINGEYDHIKLKNNFDKIYNFLDIDKSQVYINNLNIIKNLLANQRLSKI